MTKISNHNSYIKSIYSIIIFIFVFLTSFLVDAQNTTKIITVDVSKNDKLNLSEIAEDITPINLVKLEEYEVVNILKVYINSQYLFAHVMSRREEDEKWIDQVLQYSINGKFIRNIENYYEGTNKLNVPRTIIYDDQNQNLLIYYRDRSLATLNSSGELHTTQKISGIQMVYNNHIWDFENSPDVDNDKNTVHLTKTTMNGAKKDTILKYSTDSFRVGKIDGLWKVYDKLFFTTDVKNLIYSVDKSNTVKKEYDFRFINGEDQPRFIPPERFLFNKYIYYGYINGQNRYIYFYNRETDSGLNFRLQHKSSSDNFQHPQITDDILNTGYVRIFPTNSPDYIFFEGREAEREKLNLDIKNPNSFILLVKLK